MSNPKDLAPRWRERGQGRRRPGGGSLAKHDCLPLADRGHAVSQRVMVDLDKYELAAAPRLLPDRRYRRAPDDRCTCPDRCQEVDVACRPHPAGQGDRRHEAVLGIDAQRVAVSAEHGGRGVGQTKAPVNRLRRGLASFGAIDCRAEPGQRGRRQQILLLETPPDPSVPIAHVASFVSILRRKARKRPSCQGAIDLRIY
jgi:hypothetical protein